MLNNQALNTIAVASTKKGDLWQLRADVDSTLFVLVDCDSYHTFEELLDALCSACEQGARIVYAPTGTLNQLEVSTHS